MMIEEWVGRMIVLWMVGVVAAYTGAIIPPPAIRITPNREIKRLFG